MNIWNDAGVYRIEGSNNVITLHIDNFLLMEVMVVTGSELRLRFQYDAVGSGRVKSTGGEFIFTFIPA